MFSICFSSICITLVSFSFNSQQFCTYCQRAPEICFCLVAKSCPILYNPLDSSLPGSSVRGISQQEDLSGLPFPSPGDLPQSRDRTRIQKHILRTKLTAFVPKPACPLGFSFCLISMCSSHLWTQNLSVVFPPPVFPIIIG